MTKRLAFMLAIALGACAGSGTAEVRYASGVTVRSPELVAVDTDVYTLADADEPVFYTDNSYWLYRDNRWYRSSNYDRGWVYVASPSPRVRRIQSPTAYVRYRSTRQEARNAPYRDQRDGWRDDQRDGWRDGRDTRRDGRDVPTTLPPRERDDAPIIHHDDDHDGRRDMPSGNEVRTLPPRDRDVRNVPPPARVDDRSRDDDYRARRDRDARDADDRKRDEKRDRREPRRDD